MNLNKLIIFDIDGTLTNTNHVDSLFFEKAILDVLPITSIDTEWKNYKYSTDTGIVTEIILSKLKTANIPHQTIPIAHSNDHSERENIILTCINRAKATYNKVSYSKIIYVGDKLWDKIAANNLKIGFIGIGDELDTISNKDFLHISDFTHPEFEQYLI